MNETLFESLDSISNFLRVSPDLANVIRAFHKEFSLTANYPKGRRQDLVTMGAGPIYLNRVFNVEYLDEALGEKKQ
ncbi:hypothetical protein ACHAXR_005485 [Thalassiosira sp. AJA248-18]